MHQAQSQFRGFSENDSFRLKGAGASFTNRGTATAVINGTIQLGPLESFSVPAISPLVQYDDNYVITFTGEGTKKLIVQIITINLDPQLLSGGTIQINNNNKNGCQ
tara:strand:+ start:16435 stop:16752 length:318 start_codon:yes stop_codon:yes gene_type:complete